MKRVFIVGAGTKTQYDFDRTSSDLVIACDGGLAYLNEVGLVPDLVVGDFDSLGYTPQGDNVLTLPVEKNDSDVGAAVKVAWARGFRKFYLYSCDGNRLDHVYANLQTLVQIVRKGGQAALIGDTQCVVAMQGNSQLTFLDGQGFVSVFSAGTAEGVTLKGMKYPLTEYSMQDDYPIGLSNEFLDKKASVSCKAGTLFVMFERTCPFPQLISSFSFLNI